MPEKVNNEQPSRRGLTEYQYLQYLKRRMGVIKEIIELEFSDDYIIEIIRDAFDELKHYITDTRLMEIPFTGSRMSLKGKGILSVVSVYRGQGQSALQGDLENFMYTPVLGLSKNPVQGLISVGSYAQSRLAIQNQNMISQDLAFDWDSDNEILSVNLNAVRPTSLMILYIPVYTDVSELKSTYWQNLLKRLSLAYLKESLSHLRGKYTLNSSQYDLDADTLASQAASELAEIRQYLDENSDICMPIQA